MRSGADEGVDAGAMRVGAPIASAAFIAAMSISISAQTRPIAYPGTTWEKGDPQQMGWSTAKLEAAHAFVLTLPPSSVLIIDGGRVVATWGNPSLRIKISSTRKSLLSALYGIYVANGTIDLNRTLEQLGIDDDPPLSMAERQATIRMLLEARSGVYHSYVAGTPSMRANMPARGSHAPGTFWYYNNWDFNALGTIFEQATHSKIGLVFRDRIAKPIEMQDFRLTDMYYLRDRVDAQPYEKSIHPAYHFRLSARDLARFGYLYLRQGLWNGTQLIPRNWIAESTRSYSDAGEDNGYGYLWWVNGFDLPVRSISTAGALAKYMVVIPERDLIIVYMNHTEFPDNASDMSAAEIKALPTISLEQMSELLKMILSAQRPE